MVDNPGNSSPSTTFTGLFRQHDIANITTQKYSLSDFVKLGCLFNSAAIKAISLKQTTSDVDDSQYSDELKS